MAKSKKVMQVEHKGETMWLYDNGDIRNAQGHLKGKGEVPQSYIDGLKSLAEEAGVVTSAELEAKPPVAPPPPAKGDARNTKEGPVEFFDGEQWFVPEADLPVPPPAPPEIKEPPMNDLQVVVNIGRDTPDGFEASFSKSKVIGSHNIKVISGTHRHKLQEALQRIILQSNDDLRAIRDAPLVEKYHEWAVEDAKKAAHKKELKDLLKGL